MVESYTIEPADNSVPMDPEGAARTSGLAA